MFAYDIRVTHQVQYFGDPETNQTLFDVIRHRLVFRNPVNVGDSIETNGLYLGVIKTIHHNCSGSEVWINNTSIELSELEKIGFKPYQQEETTNGN